MLFRKIADYGNHYKEIPCLEDTCKLQMENVFLLLEKYQLGTEIIYILR